ncbi:glycosyl hydrolase [Microbacterium mangrovi]|uniref:Glycosyl hydrolase n=1 Tax=Microbacterium mangrovi TaxID=1348253 RepID=A0A0B2A3F4_9MICO|nr:glycosyl hydrolase [Microbacterium mangrovi]
MLAAHFDGLGVRLDDDGGTLRVWAPDATSAELVVFDEDDPDWAAVTVPMTADAAGVWEASTPALRVDARYAVRVAGPRGARHAFDADTHLLDPYARGVERVGPTAWRGVVVDESFDWGGVGKPGIPDDRTVVYEAHVRGLTKRHPLVPPALHGTYAGLAHPAIIDHLKTLGVTSIELLPVHAFASEPRLAGLSLANYWGYNTLAFFSPHAPYATAASRRGGASAVLREFKGMVRALHEAGIEVLLDVVYNHTSEGGRTEPATSLRGLADRGYYRQTDDGTYIDVTGCGNTVDTSTDAAARLILDSLRYWARECQVDGFRFDLASALGRDAAHSFTADHPLLRAIADDPELQDVKLIAEPWDVGMGGWQTGGFAPGWHEWNDRYRDRVRTFWLSDIEHARRTGGAAGGIGGLATSLAGSSNTFSDERGPLASVNFVTAHDGFTLHDLVAYDTKHNEANGEHGRDGTDTNRSFNHGAEGPTNDPRILADRRRAMRNLLGTLLLSAGTPMITAGDEFGRTQHGNNNAYCHDSDLTWLDWEHADWQQDLAAHVRHLLRLRRENPALRPRRFARLGARVPSASAMEWFDAAGQPMPWHSWDDPGHRTLQYLASSTPEFEAPNTVLLLVHGREEPVDVVLPALPGAPGLVELWSSADETPRERDTPVPPDEVLAMGPTSMRLFRVQDPTH